MGIHWELSCFISQPERSIMFRYRVPLKPRAELRRVFKIGFQSQDDNGYRSKRYTCPATRYWTVSILEWQRAMFLRFRARNLLPKV